MEHLKTQQQYRSTAVVERAVNSLKVKRAAISLEEEELRCECGSLLAKLTAKGIELKCRRCKRIFAIPYSQIEGWSRFMHT